MVKNQMLLPSSAHAGALRGDMDLFCALFGHWPVPLASRRQDGRKVNQCWMCDEAIVHAAGEWQTDDGTDAKPAEGVPRQPPRLRVAISGE